MALLTDRASAHAPHAGCGAGVRRQTVVPCMNVTAVVAYFNRADVRAALHVVPASPAWDVCSSLVNYTQYAATVAGAYLQLKDALCILVYSGDQDSCVPYLGTERAMDGLGLPVAQPWRQWHYVDPASGTQQVAGYVRTYNTSGGFNFVTVKGSGHMVPGYTPVQALALVTRFLAGEPY